MKATVYKSGFPRFHTFIIYCSLIAVVGFAGYFFKGNTDLSGPDRYTDRYSVEVEEEFENMFHLATD